MPKSTVSIADLKELKTKISAMKKNLVQSKVGDFARLASAAESALGKSFSNKILSFKKAIDSKNTKSTPKKVEKVKVVGDKLQAALSTKSTKLTVKIDKMVAKEKKAAAALKAKASKAAKAVKKPKATKAKKPKATKAKKSKAKTPASFMWGGEDEDLNESDLEFM